MNEITPPASYIWWLIGGLALFHLYLARKLFKSIKEFFQDLRKRPFIYWMTLPALVVIILTVVYPFIYNLALSLSNMGLRNFSSWQLTGFQNYAQVFREPAFYQC
jgi:arabinogalactan oligomer/maltooligosaccharide transport system permease protein